MKHVGTVDVAQRGGGLAQPPRDDGGLEGLAAELGLGELVVQRAAARGRVLRRANAMAAVVPNELRRKARRGRRLALLDGSTSG